MTNLPTPPVLLLPLVPAISSSPQKRSRRSAAALICSQSSSLVSPPIHPLVMICPIRAGKHTRAALECDSLAPANGQAENAPYISMLAEKPKLRTGCPRNRGRHREYGFRTSDARRRRSQGCSAHVLVEEGNWQLRRCLT